MRHIAPQTEHVIFVPGAAVGVVIFTFGIDVAILCTVAVLCTVVDDGIAVYIRFSHRNSPGKKRFLLVNALFAIAEAFNQFPYAIAKVIAASPVIDERSLCRATMNLGGFE
tara:strand:- start:6385 stop:6717 length:333 start_codon:yes stop_codon:yes gene_type:complete